MRTSDATNPDSVHTLFEALERLGLGRESVHRTLTNASATFVLDAFQDLRQICRQLHETRGKRHHYVANRSLSGDRHPCADANCRIPNVRRLATFAAIYGDRVLVQDPLDCARWVNAQTAAADIDILHELRPLLEAGLVRFARRRGFFCESHWNEFDRKTELFQRAALAMEAIEGRCLREVEVYAQAYPNGLAQFRWVGPEDIVPHGAMSLIGRTPVDDLKHYCKVDREEKIPIALALKHGIVSTPKDAVAELLVQNIYASWGYTYLSDSPITQLAVQAANGQDAKLTSDALTGLEHAVPEAFSAPIEKLIGLRDAESEAFEVYRDRLAYTVEEVRAQKLSTAATKELFESKVRPELNRLTKTVHESRRGTNAKIGVDLAACGIVGVTVFSGILSPEMMTLLASVSGLTVAKCLLDDAKGMVALPPAVRESDYFFLWKAMKL